MWITSFIKFHRNFILFLLFFVFVFAGNAQSSYQTGLLPSVNLNKKLPRDWAVNFKAESRQSIYDDELNIAYLLTDLSLSAAKKIGINSTIIAGYLLRAEKEEIKHRAIQQLVFVRRYTGFRLSHRVATDQTFEKDDNTEFRFRYRLSSEIPLAGQSLDPKEFFLKFSNEYLNIISGSDYDLEIRGAAFLGYVFSPSNKFELGIDYRVNSFINSSSRNRIWIGLNFYQSI
jgi:hypothetical protein